MKKLFLSIFFLLITLTAFSQSTEYYFKFKIHDRTELNYITQIISIDNVVGDNVYAYANPLEFAEFLRLGYTYTSLPHPGSLINPRMSNDPAKIVLDWDYYPTYDAYIAMMNQFAVSYPTLCRIVNAGSTVQGRSILFAVISQNVNTHEAEPQFMYSSSMHGNELTGYVLMLRMINYLLTNYGTDPKVTNLLNHEEIWINPLANPDGTYHGGNNTVSGAIRYNYNNVDLNRNYPNKQMGPHPDGNAWQPETIDMMNVLTANHFTLACNFHDGAEVVNYPWDTWSRLHADDNWWIFTSRQYADTVHANSVPGYMTDLNNGITNGFAWYVVYGSRQDYTTYYKHGREVTIELSHSQPPQPGQLPAYWDYNWKSMFHYMEKPLYGIRGSIKDSITIAPIGKANVFISGHDIDSSDIYSDSTFGMYYRMIKGGTYSITFSAPNYYSKTISGVYAKDDSTTILNVLLRPYPTLISNNNGSVPGKFELYQNYPNPFNPTTKIKFDIPSNVKNETSNVKLIIYDILGKEVASLIPPQEKLHPGTYEVEWNASSYPSGVYFYKLTVGDLSATKKLILLK
jgi:hypothetical protein